jgi:Domain of unknown function (DUF4824)
VRPWTRRQTLLAGLALLAATNAVVLGGVAYNRSGEAESVLRLSQRELAVPYSWGLARDNSGISLRLKWRVAGSPEVGYNRAAPWLDRAKLRDLGFDLSLPARGDGYADRLSREVLLVLELDGEATRAALASAEERLAQAQSRFAANPAERSLKFAADNAARQLALERDGESRLFVIDAGREISALRARYPDRARYAIVRGQVRANSMPSRDGSGPVGYVSELSVPEVNVPARERRLFVATRARFPARNAKRELRYEVTLAFGRRLEPWLVDARAAGD